MKPPPAHPCPTGKEAYPSRSAAVDRIKDRMRRFRASSNSSPHRLYLGNAYTIRPTLGWMDCDCMDPPYVIATSGGGSFRNERPYLDQIAEEGLDIGFEAKIINPLMCGSVVVFCHNDQVPEVSTYINGSFHRFALCVWKKLTPMPVANKHYQPELEIYMHGWNRGYHPQGDLLDLKRVVECRSRARSDFGHPTVKPDAVMNKIMRNIAGTTVCDPFMGTGSTGVAAIRAGKTFTGIEHNPTHFQTAITRLSAAYQETCK